MNDNLDFMTEKKKQLTELLDIRLEYRHLLQKQQAQLGLHSPPALIIELEKIQEEIYDLKKQLEQIEPFSVSESSKVTAPTQYLPPRSEFIGRNKEKEEILNALCSRAYIIVLEGIGGIGKTSLALESVHESLKKKLFDKVIWVSCAENTELNNILKVTAKSLNYDIKKPDYKNLTKDIYILLQKQRTLMVLDNFESVEDEQVYKFIQKVPEPTKVLVTTRKQFTNHVFIIPIKGLQQDESFDLITTRAKQLGISELTSKSIDTFVDRLHKLTGGVPLAIEWAIGQIKRGRPNDSVIRDLVEARGEIYEEIFHQSWNMLSNDAKKMIKALVIFITPVNRRILQVICDIDETVFEKAIVELVELFLVERSNEINDPSYSLHSLIKHFVESYMVNEPDIGRNYYVKSVNYFLRTLSKYSGRTNWYGYKGHDEIEKNKVNIFHIRKWCFENAKWKPVIELQNLLSRFLYTRGYWKERIEFGQDCLCAARQINDKLNEGLCLAEDIGYMLFKRGELPQAMTYIQEGIKILIDENDLTNVSRSFIRLSYIAVENKDFESTIKFSREAIEYAQKIEDPADSERMVAVAKEHLSDIYLESENFEEAKALLSDSEEVFTKIDDQFRLVRVTFHKGMIEFEQKLFSNAKTSFEKTVELAQEISRKDYEYRAKMMLAKIEKGEGNINNALILLKQAQKGFISLGATKLISQTTKLEKELQQMQNQE